MSCKAGYPGAPCPFEFKGRVTRATCGTCINYEPPPHILRWCMLWDRDKTLCLKPMSACATCPERAPQRPPGRPGDNSPVDWKDPESVRAYYREQAKRNPDARTRAMATFLERNPDYFSKYRQQNRDRIRENQARYRERKRREREQGEPQVQRDPHGPRSERDEDLPAPGPDDARGPRRP